MKGDFTRDTFVATKHYTGVLLQQGRVQLDADWNEQSSIARYRMRRLAADVIGPHGGPAAELGFGLTDDENVIATLADRYGRPLDGARADALRERLRNSDFLIGTGRYYVDGLMCENDEPLSYGQQPGYPFDADTDLFSLRRVTKFLLYLDVWERHATMLDDDSIREVALDGPDTATRSQLVWQVKVLRPRDGQKQVDESDLASATARAWSGLRARAKVPPDTTEDCTIDPEAAYRGAENQLYRVEIHRGGPGRADDPAAADGATFVWSRENGSVIFDVVTIEESPADKTISVALASLGRDESLGLAVGDWVEIVDEPTVLRELGGQLRRVHAIRPDDLTVVLDGVLDVDLDLSGPVILRRWDHGSTVAADNALAVIESDLTAPRWLPLEDGVEVMFETESIPGVPNDYRVGDFWLIPARVATGDVEWPQQEPAGAQPVPAAMPPRGVQHVYAPLAQASMSAAGALTIGADFRKRFAGIAV